MSPLSYGTRESRESRVLMYRALVEQSEIAEFQAYVRQFARFNQSEGWEIAPLVEALDARFECCAVIGPCGLSVDVVRRRIVDAFRAIGVEKDYVYLYSWGGSRGVNRWFQVDADEASLKEFAVSVWPLDYFMGSPHPQDHLVLANFFQEWSIIAGPSAFVSAVCEGNVEEFVADAEDSARRLLGLDEGSALPVPYSLNGPWRR